MNFWMHIIQGRVCQLHSLPKMWEGKVQIGWTNVGTHEDFTPFPFNPTTKMDVLTSHHVTITTMACMEQKHGWARVPCCG